MSIDWMKPEIRCVVPNNKDIGNKKKMQFIDMKYTRNIAISWQKGNH